MGINTIEDIFPKLWLRAEALAILSAKYNSTLESIKTFEDLSYVLTLNGSKTELARSPLMKIININGSGETFTAGDTYHQIKCNISSAYLKDPKRPSISAKDIIELNEFKFLVNLVTGSLEISIDRMTVLSRSVFISSGISKIEISDDAKIKELIETFISCSGSSKDSKTKCTDVFSPINQNFRNSPIKEVYLKESRRQMDLFKEERDAQRAEERRRKHTKALETVKILETKAEVLRSIEEDVFREEKEIEDKKESGEYFLKEIDENERLGKSMVRMLNVNEWLKKNIENFDACYSGVMGGREEQMDDL